MEVKKYLIISLFLLLGSLFINAGQVVVKDGGLNVTEDFFVDNSVLFVNSSSGNVGVGTMSPDKALHIYDSNNANPAIRVQSDTTGSGASDGMLLEMNDDSSVLVWNYENAPLRFGTSGSERVRITSDGNVGIGTINPLDKLEVRDNSTGVVAKFSGGDANGMELDLKADTSGTGNEFKLGVTDDSHPWGEGMYFYDVPASARRIMIDGTGYVTFYNGHGDSSSQVMKTNITVIDNALEKTMQLRGVYFDWIADGRHDMGMLIEDVEKVVPEVVHENNGAKALSYDRLIGLTVEAVKELNTKVQEQQNHIELLKSELCKKDSTYTWCGA